MSVITDRPAGGRSFDPATATAILVTIVAWASAFPAIRAGLGGRRAVRLRDSGEAGDAASGMES